MQNDNSKLKIIKYLGIDWGEKRIGLSVGDSETKLATPLKIVSSIEEVIGIIEEEEIDILVVGLPVKMDEKQSSSSVGAMEFIDKLKSLSDVLIDTVDERLTSRAADALEGDKKTKADRDATAAMLILQTYLDRSEN